jgi:hypothetical protein
MPEQSVDERQDTTVGDLMNIIENEHDRFIEQAEALDDQRQQRGQRLVGTDQGKCMPQLAVRRHGARPTQGGDQVGAEAHRVVVGTVEGEPGDQARR